MSALSADAISEDLKAIFDRIDREGKVATQDKEKLLLFLNEFRCRPNIVSKDILEKTRLGKIVNNVRKKIADEELKKQFKELLREWQRNFLKGSDSDLRNGNQVKRKFGNGNDSIEYADGEGSQEYIIKRMRTDLSRDSLDIDNGRSDFYVDITSKTLPVVEHGDLETSKVVENSVKKVNDALSNDHGIEDPTSPDAISQQGDNVDDNKNTNNSKSNEKFEISSKIKDDSNLHKPVISNYSSNASSPANPWSVGSMRRSSCQDIDHSSLNSIEAVSPIGGDVQQESNNVAGELRTVSVDDNKSTTLNDKLIYATNKLEGSGRKQRVNLLDDVIASINECESQAESNLAKKNRKRTVQLNWKVQSVDFVQKLSNNINNNCINRIDGVYGRYAYNGNWCKWDMPMSTPNDDLVILPYIWL